MKSLRDKQHIYINYNNKTYKYGDSILYSFFCHYYSVFFFGASYVLLMGLIMMTFDDIQMWLSDLSNEFIGEPKSNRNDAA